MEWVSGQPMVGKETAPKSVYVSMMTSEPCTLGQVLVELMTILLQPPKGE